jgi:hypothetical protein
MDRTQGPACAIACPAGTVYRNYFSQGGQAGGSARQLDTSADLGAVLDNARHGYWRMRNGYLLPSERPAGRPSAMAEVAARLAGESASPAGQQRDGEATPSRPAADASQQRRHPPAAAAGHTAAGAMAAASQGEGSLASAARSALRVGIHWDTDTAARRGGSGGTPHRVCQVFCSALPGARFRPIAHSLYRSPPEYRRDAGAGIPGLC